MFSGSPSNSNDFCSQYSWKNIQKQKRKKKNGTNGNQNGKSIDDEWYMRMKKERIN